MPKDKVGGDLYWFGEVNGKKIVFVGDCTGHGVPGAMLSMLTAGFINQIVNRDKVDSPVRILNEISDRLADLVKGNKYQGYFGLDASIMIISKTKAVYAGAMNGIYHLKDGDLKFLKPSLTGLGADLPMKIEIIEQEIELGTSNKFFLYSDGFMDQINDSKEKYNRSKFEKLLINVGKSNLENKLFESELNSWQESAAQLDDICVLGFKA